MPKHFQKRPRNFQKLWHIDIGGFSGKPILTRGTPWRLPVNGRFFNNVPVGSFCLFAREEQEVRKYRAGKFSGRLQEVDGVATNSVEALGENFPIRCRKPVAERKLYLFAERKSFVLFRYDGLMRISFRCVRDEKALFCRGETCDVGYVEQIINSGKALFCRA